MEAVGAAAGLLELLTFALKSTLALHDAIVSFGSHKKRVADLAAEAGALNGALVSIRDYIASRPISELSALRFTLHRCGTVCHEFLMELQKCLAHSGGDKTSFRDWAKMRYMGEDIDGFRRSLAAYKSTVCIALTDATLRKSAATAEGLEVYTDLVRTAQADLEDRLEVIDDKLDLLLDSKTTLEAPQEDELSLATEERSSTKRWLQVCVDLTSHIIDITKRMKPPLDAESDAQSTASQRIGEYGLRECVDSLERAAHKIRQCEEQSMERLLRKLDAAASTADDHADLKRFREEREAVQQNMEVCARALRYIQEKEMESTIDNYAIGDAVQIMVSTNEKTINGKNRGLGWRSRQVGGHMNDESLQQIARTLMGLHVDDAVAGSEKNNETIEISHDDSSASRFQGVGHKLKVNEDPGGPSRLIRTAY